MRTVETTLGFLIYGCCRAVYWFSKDRKRITYTYVCHKRIVLEKGICHSFSFPALSSLQAARVARKDDKLSMCGQDCRVSVGACVNIAIVCLTGSYDTRMSRKKKKVSLCEHTVRPIISIFLGRGDNQSPIKNLNSRCKFSKFSGNRSSNSIGSRIKHKTAVLTSTCRVVHCATHADVPEINPSSNNIWQTLKD